MSNPHAGHRDRLKSRFLIDHGKTMEKHELLELLLYYAIPQKDTNPIAHELLDTFGSISAVFDAPVERLQEVKGVGKSAAVLLKMVPMLTRTYLEDSYSPGNIFNNTEEVGRFLIPKFIGSINEEVYVICLDNKKRIIHSKKVHEGKMNAVEISTQKIVEYALLNKASGVIVAHNHPNGIAVPSSADLTSTHKIYQALKLLGIRLMDHLVIAGDDFVSMAESGILSSF